MDHRISRVRRKLASLAYQPHRSHSFGEERHKFQLGPRIPKKRIAAFEAEREIDLPAAYREFLLYLGGTGAAPFHGLMPLERCSLHTLSPPSSTETTRGFGLAGRAVEGDLFLQIIEMGCTDAWLIAVTGPLTGRILIGNLEGYRGPNASSASDSLSCYERWLDHMHAGRDNRALELTSP
ncbi:SMI1/KNR4 family protein [Actinomadura sp. LOL_016]|uniref:SMI1/KNR4 family protein n=1 Tax=unclassified Actinomadura TaxID=2626254 RepID=UPI003A801D08